MQSCCHSDPSIKRPSPVLLDWVSTTAFPQLKREPDNVSSPDLEVRWSKGSFWSYLRAQPVYKDIKMWDLQPNTQYCICKEEAAVPKNALSQSEHEWIPLILALCVRIQLRLRVSQSSSVATFHRAVKCFSVFLWFIALNLWFDLHELQVLPFYFSHLVKPTYWTWCDYINTILRALEHISDKPREQQTIAYEQCSCLIFTGSMCFYVKMFALFVFFSPNICVFFPVVKKDPRNDALVTASVQLVMF